MFLGHVGIGLGLKAAAPRASLGTLLLASLFIDLLWPFLLLLGFEHVEISPGDTALTPLSFTYYPFSHSLLAVVFWAALFGGITYLIRRSSRHAWVFGMAVLSHWVLDLLVHKPDIPSIFPIRSEQRFRMVMNTTILKITSRPPRKAVSVGALLPNKIAAAIDPGPTYKGMPSGTIILGRIDSFCSNNCSFPVS